MNDRHGNKVALGDVLEICPAFLAMLSHEFELVQKAQPPEKAMNGS